MERVITQVLGERLNGTKIVRNFFVNDDKTNYLVKAQSYYTKEEKKIAKLNHKNN